MDTGPPALSRGVDRFEAIPASVHDVNARWDWPEVTRLKSLFSNYENKEMAGSESSN